jgi:class 3 adenylate cyclase
VSAAHNHHPGHTGNRAALASPAAMRRQSLRPWQWFSTRMVAAFVLVTVFAIGLAAWLMFRGLAEVPLLGRLEALRDVQGLHQVLEEIISAKLLNLARTGVLLIDPLAQAEAQHTLDQDSEAYQRVRTALASIRQAGELTTPLYTLTDYHATARQVRVVVVSDADADLQPGALLPLAPEAAQILSWTFEDGFARTTPIYRKWNPQHQQQEQWMTAFAPIVDTADTVIAVVAVEHHAALFSYWFEALALAIGLACVGGGLVATAVGIWLAWRVTRPISALTRGVARVADGDLSQSLPVRSGDEVGQLTHAFNGMLDGLRQRDFIRDTFGRYVSPEVVRTLIGSPDGLHLGGEKRDVTILMSDLRGYTQLSEQSDPAVVVQILNGYLARMTDVIIEHGGTINEFIGDAIFAIFGAPLSYPDHAERAAACALAMQLAMTEVNQANAAHGWPQLEMGIGLNSGEAIVGNIGSEKRAKFGVVGSTVNLAARVEGTTVGSQILLSPFTYERLREIANVRPPISVQVKGISESLLLYELRGLDGRYALQLPDTAADESLTISVALPLQCWVIEDKTVRPESIRGEVVRLSLRQCDARLAVHVPPTTNVRLRLHYPALAQDSADLYGKVLTVQAQAGVWLTRIGLTSVSTADQRLLETLLMAPVPVPPG